MLRKIQYFLLNKNNFEINVKGINDLLLRVGKVRKNEYDKKLEKIRNAKCRYLDEAGFKVNGKNGGFGYFEPTKTRHWSLYENKGAEKSLMKYLGKITLVPI